MRKAKHKLVIAILLTAFFWAPLCIAHPADSYRFSSPNTERRAMSLARELRCPQCQNQNLMESNSPVAMDLRLEVYRLIDNGKTDDAVIHYMTERFGDFVLYNPPLKTGTLLLWGAPILLLMMSIGLLIRFNTHSQATHPCPPNKPTRTEERPTAPQIDMSKPAKIGLGMTFIATILVIISAYSLTGRWQLSEYWRRNPDPILIMDAEQLKDASLKRLQEKLRHNPKDVESWAELGQLYTYRDDFAHALQVYDRIALIEGSMSASTAAAKATVLYYQAGQQLSKEARTLLDLSLGLDPGEVTALMLLASDYFLQADYPNAIKLWQKLLDDQRPRINREQIIQAIHLARQLSHR